MQRRRRISVVVRSVAFVGLLLILAQRATAYNLIGTRWMSSTVTMHLQLGAGSGPLMDGFSSWGAAAEDALNLWNSQIRNLRFTVVPDSTAARAQGNRLNNVHFAADVYGQSFGSGVLAITLTYSSGTSQTETDVVFNNRASWSSYRGVQRYSPTGAPTYDFHRVALHEFGHALGLHHPDEAGQSVAALMNSRITSLDALTADDISGAQALYGAPAPAVTVPVITLQPVNRSVTTGSSMSFTVGVSNSGGIAYQWLKDGLPLAGATSATLTLNNVTTGDAGNYTAWVSNSAGSVTSAIATLSVTAAPPVVPPPTFTTPPVIPAPPPPAPVAAAPRVTTQPIGQTIRVGQEVTFSMTANGTASQSLAPRARASRLPACSCRTPAPILRLSGTWRDPRSVRACRW